MHKWIQISRFRVLTFATILAAILVFLATTTDANIAPLRNIVAYRLVRWSGQRIGAHQPTGILKGCVLNQQGRTIAGARIVVSEWNGVLHHGQSDKTGCYRIEGLPAGRYVPLAEAPGYDLASLRPWGLPIRISAGEQKSLDISLTEISLPTILPGRELSIGEPITLTWTLPQPSSAVRRELHYDSGGRQNQLTYLYHPLDQQELRPTLLAIYPGPADQWEGVSIPLASAGYPVIAVGPAYALDLEEDIAEIQRLVAFARAGELPGVDSRRMAVLGGSYSSLHVQRLLTRDNGFRSVLLLGPATDLFELRQRFEEGSFFPPFGLDQALIALGTPDTEPERYWRYSSRYHLRRDLPPILLMHSRSDNVIPFQQSEILDAELSQLGIPHETHFFDGMSHYLLADRPSQDLTTLYTLTLDFFERTLGATDSETNRGDAQHAAADPGSGLPAATR